jgi:iron(III) transport system substrate-binding protein
VLVLPACGGGSADSEPLIVYSGRSEDLVSPLIDRFESDTGIEVEVRYGDSTELAATLLAEGASTDADVFFAQDPASLGAVSDLLAELPGDVLGQVPSRFADRSGKWIGTSGRVRVLVFDSSTVEPDSLPSTVDDLTGPEWAGALGVAPINGSFLAFVGAMILERGEDATLEWLRAIADNGPVDFPGNSPIVAAVDGGEVTAGLVNHYYLFRLQAEGEGTRAANHFFAAGDVGGLVMPAGVGILAETGQRDAADQFVGFLLSESSQEYFASETFEYPLIPGVQPDAGLPPIDQVVGPNIDLSDLADVLDRATDLVTEAGLL